MSAYFATGVDELRLQVWRVERLRQLAANEPLVTVPVESLGELDQEIWFASGVENATCRRVALHARRIFEADLTYPIVLSSSGAVMDGTHRLAKAWLLGQASIRAHRFLCDPEPDVIMTSDEFERLCRLDESARAQSASQDSLRSEIKP